MAQNGPKKDQKWAKMGFLQIWSYHISLERLWGGKCNFCKVFWNFSLLGPKWPKMAQKRTCKHSNDIWYNYTWRKPICCLFLVLFRPLWAISSKKWKFWKIYTNVVFTSPRFPTIYDTTILEENPFFAHFWSFLGHFGPIRVRKWKLWKIFTKVVFTSPSFPTIYDTTIFEEHPFLPIFGPFLVHFGPCWA